MLVLCLIFQLSSQILLMISQSLMKTFLGGCTFQSSVLVIYRWSWTIRIAVDTEASPITRYSSFVRCLWCTEATERLVSGPGFANKNGFLMKNLIKLTSPKGRSGKSRWRHYEINWPRIIVMFLSLDTTNMRLKGWWVSWTRLLRLWRSSWKLCGLLNIGDRSRLTDWLLNRPRRRVEKTKFSHYRSMKQN